MAVSCARRFWDCSVSCWTFEPDRRGAFTVVSRRARKDCRCQLTADDTSDSNSVYEKNLRARV